MEGMRGEEGGGGGSLGHGIENDDAAASGGLFVDIGANIGGGVGRAAHAYWSVKGCSCILIGPCISPMSVCS